MKTDSFSAEGNASPELKNLLPRKQVGFLFPVSVCDITPYEFYRIVPEGIMLVMVDVGIKAFTSEELKRVIKPLDEYLALFKQRGVDVILQDGCPVACLQGPEQHKKMLAHIEEKTGIQATSTYTCVSSAAQFLNIRNLAVVNKWDSDINNGLGTCLKHDGIRIVGTRNQAMAPSDFLSLKNEDSMTLAYNLARNALKGNPDADGLYIGGGSWLTAPIINLLEQEFDKPVISNTTSIIWHLCRLLNFKNPVRGFGRLLHHL